MASAIVQLRREVYNVEEFPSVAVCSILQHFQDSEAGPVACILYLPRGASHDRQKLFKR
jgi:hypothetical protein